MAYRKVDEASLVAIADKLREMFSTTDKISFPSGFEGLMSFLVYPSGVIAIDKPGNYDVKNYERAIVTASGNLPSGISAIDSGVVTYESAQYGPSIPHGLGVAPNFFYVVATGDVSISNNTGYMVGHFACKQTFEGKAGHYTNISISSAGVNTMSGNVIAAADIDGYFGAESFKPYGFFKAGVTYRWVAGVIDGLV